jgi:DNA-binding NarL/FixJ family response regulator
MGRPVVLVVDDHEMVGASFLLALADRGLDGRYCGATSAVDILAASRGLLPGLVLLDLDLGRGADGVPIDPVGLVIGFAARGWPSLLVTGITDDRRLATAIAAGALGVVPKSAPLADLLAVVETAMAGQPVLTRDERTRWTEAARRHRRDESRDNDRLHRLSQREREVLECLADGERAATVARRHVVALATVRSHIQSILMKLEVNSQLEAVALLRRHGGGR